MAGGTAIAIDVGRCGDAWIIRPNGACTLLACGPILAWLESASPAERVVFDLSLATGLDSTFAGMLVSLARPRSGDHRQPLHLAQPSVTARDALQRMHVLSVFDVKEQWSDTPAHWESLPAAPSDAAQSTRCMLNAHERLIEVDSRNQASFGGVVDALRREQKNRDSN